jgi:uncharacterized protein YlxW (UPF0749 family)
MSTQQVSAPAPQIQGEGTVTAPASRIEQVARLQDELRKVRAQRANLQERQNNLESSLAQLHAELSALNKLAKLSPQELEALKRLQG